MKQIKVDETVIPKMDGVFFKRTLPKHYHRFYPCLDNDGDLVFGKHVVCHWIDKTRFECSGTPECPYCQKKVKKTYKKMVALVDLKASPDKMQLWEMPISVWIRLKKFIDENGIECLGDDGITFCIEYDAKESPSSQYSISPVLRHKVQLSNDENLLSFNPVLTKDESVIEVDDMLSDSNDISEQINSDDTDDTDDTDMDDMLF